MAQGSGESSGANKPESNKLSCQQKDKLLSAPGLTFKPRRTQLPRVDQKQKVDAFIDLTGGPEEESLDMPSSEQKEKLLNDPGLKKRRSQRLRKERKPKADPVIDLIGQPEEEGWDMPNHKA